MNQLKYLFLILSRFFEFTRVIFILFCWELSSNHLLTNILKECFFLSKWVCNILKFKIVHYDPYYALWFMTLIACEKHKYISFSNLYIKVQLSTSKHFLWFCFRLYRPYYSFEEGFKIMGSFKTKGIYGIW